MGAEGSKKEREARKAIESYLVAGESLLAFTSTDALVGPRKPLIGLTPERVILVGSAPGEPSGGVYSIRRDNIALIRWSGLWSRLKIRIVFPQQEFDFLVYGWLWKKRAKEFATAAESVPAESSGDVDLMAAKRHYTQRVLDIGELALGALHPKAYLEEAQRLGKKGLIESAERRYLQCVRDLQGLGKIRAARRSLDAALQSHPALRADPLAASLLAQLERTLLSLRVGAGFLFGNIWMTVFSVIFMAMFVGMQDAKSFLLRGPGAVVLYDLPFSVGLWRGNSKFRTWVILRAVASFVLFALGAIPEKDYFSLIIESAFSVATFLALMGTRKRNILLAICIYVVGFLGGTVAWWVALVMRVLGRIS